MPTGSEKERLSGRQLRSWVALAAIAFASFLIVIVGQRWLPVIASADRSLDDLKIALLTPPQPQRDDIAVAEITEDTLARFPYRSPINRAFLAEAVNALADAGVKGLVIDVLFDQPTEPEKDSALRQALAAFPAPVIASWSDGRGGLTEGQQAYIDDFLAEVDRGFANLVKDRDGIARRMFRGDVVDGEFVYGLPLAVADAIGIPVPDEPLRIAYARPEDPDKPTFRQFPIHTVSLLPAAWFEDRIVFIGADLPQEDRHLTPLATAYGAGAGNIPGVVIHAHAMAQLLDGRNILELSESANATLIAAFVVAGAVLAVLETALAVKIGLAIVAFGIAVAGSGFAFVEKGYLVPVFAPIIGLGLAGGFATAYVGGRDRAEKRFIRQAFSRYVSPAIVHQLVSDPGRLQLGGQRRDLTFVFTDIAGFTTLAESTEPTALVAVLNEYLDEMSRIVLRHEGTIDKYVGDAVMAFFGAPLAQADHAARAVRCAKEMNRFAAGFRSEAKARGVDLGETRIGVHTGEAIVGNFGGEARFDYTAIGDAVNTAARLEGANKFFGTAVCVSGTTVAQCGDMAFRPIGDLVLKGKTLPIPTYEPVTDALNGHEYSVAFERLRAGDGNAAFAFESLVKRYPDDPLAAFHCKRIAEGQTGVRIEMTDK